LNNNCINNKGLFTLKNLNGSIANTKIELDKKQKYSVNHIKDENETISFNFQTTNQKNHENQNEIETVEKEKVCLNAFQRLKDSLSKKQNTNTQESEVKMCSFNLTTEERLKTTSNKDKDFFEEISFISQVDEKKINTPKKTTTAKKIQSPNHSKNKSFKDLKKNLNFMNMSISQKTCESFFSNQSQSIKSIDFNNFNKSKENSLVQSKKKKEIMTNSDSASLLNLVPVSSDKKLTESIKSFNFYAISTPKNEKSFNNQELIKENIIKTTHKETDNDFKNENENYYEVKIDINENDFIPSPVFDIEFVQNLIENDSNYQPKFTEFNNLKTQLKEFDFCYETFIRTRALYLDWMMEISEDFGFKRDTFHFAVNYFDRYLIKKRFSVKKSQLKLLSSSCLLIASKLEEIQIPRAEEYVNSSNSEFKIEELMYLEIQVSQVS